MVTEGRGCEANPEEGIRVDRIMMSEDDISILFGFTRSYFFVDLEPVEGAIFFIHSLLPGKPIDELFTVLGRLRQGKTERYQMFSKHLATCEDRFVTAAGDRGLVMIVFTLPSYDLVFKVIRDKFGAPKNTTPFARRPSQRCPAPGIAQAARHRADRM